MNTADDADSQEASALNQSSAGTTSRDDSPSHTVAEPARRNSNPHPGSSSGAPSSSKATISKRSRNPDVVTANACTECRKKRAKCDGQDPCARCKSQPGLECVYTIPVRQSKENLRVEIEKLRRFARSSERIFAALSRPDLSNDILLNLRGGQPIETISEWLRGAPAAGPIGLPTIRQSPQPSIPVSADNVTLPGFEYLGLGDIADIGSGVEGNGAFPFGQADVSHRHDPTHTRFVSHPMNLPAFDVERDIPELKGPEVESQPTWTRVTQNPDLVKHLLALYFCWEYPTFASFSKQQFLQDFQDGRHRYCSSLLTNALLALGCRFSTQPMTRAIPDNPYSAGDHFFRESQHLLALEKDHHTLTTIQALGIMSIREASCGRDSESWYYAGQSAKLALEMGLQDVTDEGDEDEFAVRSATFWGAFALDHAWALATGSLPQFSRSPYLPPKPAIIDDIEASLWVPYTDDGIPMQLSYQQPSNVRSVYQCFCELSELVHRGLYTLYAPGEPLTARDILGIYTQHLTWYDHIPEVLKLGYNFTPAVLFTHMYYHFSILLLFRPFLKLKIIDSQISPRDICIQAALAIQKLLKSYSKLYTLQRTPSFVPYFVLTSTLIHLTVAPMQTRSGVGGSGQESQVTEALSQGMADLEEMAPCHHFASKALDILRYFARQWGSGMDIDGGMAPEDSTNPSQRPTGSTDFFAPSGRTGDPLSDSEPARGTPRGFTDRYIALGGTDIAENPTFWPFPMQGRPTLPNRDNLERAGFSML